MGDDFQDNLFCAADRGIIIAADVRSLDELRSLSRIGAAISEVVAIKVGFTLALGHGLRAVVDNVSEVSTLPVIYDHQKAGTDIPQMGRPFAEVCRDAGVRGVIFFPQAGPRSLEGFVMAAIEHALTPIVGLVMTHSAYLQSDGGYIADDAPEAMCKDAIALGVKDFVLPGTKPDIVARFSNGPIARCETAAILMPGIGSQGGSLTKAFAAAAPHRRFAIIGSAIYRADDPRTALNEFAGELSK